MSTATVTNDQKPAPPPPKSWRTEWSWRHGPVIGPFNAGAALVGAGMVGDLTGVPGWWGAIGGAAVAVASAHSAVKSDVSAGGIFYRAGCWGAAGGWLSWALATSAWSPSVLAAAVVGTLGAAVAGREMAEHETVVKADRAAAVRSAAKAQAELADQTERVELAKEWEDRLERICRIAGSQVAAIQYWPRGVGYTLQVKLPAGGATWTRVQKEADALASDAELPPGCEVQAAQGPNSKRDVLIRVATVDGTAEPTEYPDDYSRLTFNGPLPVGVYRDTDTTEIVLLEDPMLIVGRRGSGKTVLLQVINAALARCPDALIWHIDLNGSGMSLPWIEPWLDGEMNQPIIDWAATTPEEALLMVRTLVDMAKGRKVVYRKRMKDANDDKLPIDSTVPAIVLVLDEGAEAVAINRGHAALATAFGELVSVARASRCQFVGSALRATSDIVPPEMQAQIGTKVYVRPESEHEIAQLFGWGGANASDAPHEGSALIKTARSQAITPFRGLLLRPADIRKVALATAARRPVLDAETARFGGKAYAERWDRYQTWLTKQTGEHHMPPTPNDEGQAPEEQPDPAGPNTRPGTPAPGVAGLGAAAANMDDAVKRMLARKAEVEAQRAQAEQGSTEPPKLNDDAVASLFEEIVGAEDWTSSAPGEESTPQERMVEILRAAGPAGLHIDALVEQLAKVGIEKSKPTVYRWLGMAKASGLVRGGDGKDGRWAAVDQRGT